MWEWIYIGESARLDRAEADRLEKEGKIEEAAKLRFSTSMATSVAWVVIGVVCSLVGLAMVGTPSVSGFGATALVFGIIVFLIGIGLVSNTYEKREEYIKETKKRIAKKKIEDSEKRRAAIIEEERIRAEIRAQIEEEMKVKKKEK